MEKRNCWMEPGPACGTCSNQLWGPRNRSEPRFLTCNVEKMHLPRVNATKVLTVTSEVVACSPPAAKIQTRGREGREGKGEIIYPRSKGKILKCHEEVTSR